MYGYNNLDILLFNRDVSSYKNNAEINVPRHATNPRNGLFNPKNSKVKL